MLYLFQNGVVVDAKGLWVVGFRVLGFRVQRRLQIHRLDRCLFICVVLQHAYMRFLGVISMSIALDEEKGPTLMKVRGKRQLLLVN